METYADRLQLLPLGDNRPGDNLMGFHAVTIHETDNERPTATAQMHHDYWNIGGEGRTKSSIHYVTDGRESIQLIPTNEIAWHIGDGADQPQKDEAFYTVGIEICVNSRTAFRSACYKAAQIVARVLQEKGVAPIDGKTIRKHGSYAATGHKFCPRHLNDRDWGVTWEQFIEMVEEAFGGIELIDNVVEEELGRYRVLYNNTFCREAPHLDAPIAWHGMCKLEAGHIVDISEIVRGEKFRGNNKWAHWDAAGFIWLPQLERIVTV